MRHKRKSAFRYTFDEPVPALFKITKVNDNQVETSDGKAYIVDISPDGAKLTTELKLPIEKIELSITFSLNHVDLTFQGKVVRGKEKMSLNEYGIEFIDHDEEKEVLIKQLKSIAKQKHDTIQL